MALKDYGKRETLSLTYYNSKCKIVFFIIIIIDLTNTEIGDTDW